VEVTPGYFLASPDSADAESDLEVAKAVA